MTKTNKLTTGIFAMAFMLLFQLNGWSQSGRQSVNTATVTTSTESDQLQQQITNLKAELQNGMSQNRLSQEEIDSYNNRIAMKEKKLNELNPQAKAAVKQQPAPAPSPSLSNVEGNSSTQPALKKSSSYPANDALNDFRADSPIPELNTLRHSLLSIKAELESRKATNGLTDEFINRANTKMAAVETRIQSLVPSEQEALKKANSK